MEFIKVFIVTQVIFLIFQFIYGLRLEPYQYCELVFGSFFIVVFFGFFGSILVLDMMNPHQTVLNNSALFASFYAIWLYITKKLTNVINSDKNGVIYY